jgi:hypothetical protein
MSKIRLLVALVLTLVGASVFLPPTEAAVAAGASAKCQNGTFVSCVGAGSCIGTDNVGCSCTSGGVLTAVEECPQP